MLVPGLTGCSAGALATGQSTEFFLIQAFTNTSVLMFHLAKMQRLSLS